MASNSPASKNHLSALRNRIKPLIPEALHGLFRPVNRTLQTFYDGPSRISFVSNPPKFPGMTYSQRVQLARRLDRIHFNVKSAHSLDQIVAMFNAILSMDDCGDACIVEAGSFKGGSATKFSVLAKMLGCDLCIFDSFEGIPDNDEPHEDGLFNQDLRDRLGEGTYCGALEEVKTNIEKFGEIEVCQFHKGWFDDTLPGFSRPIRAIFIDVDLVSSNRTCLKHLYPLLVPGGMLASHDGHIPLVLELLQDDKFWEEEVGYAKPPMEGFGTNQLILARKPVDSEIKPSHQSLRGS